MTGTPCEFAGPEFFFADRHGHRVRGNTIYQAFVRARDHVGVTISFHDLRHTGQSLAAATGASLVDLKKRLGHSSTAAAQRYMHAVDAETRISPRPCQSWPAPATRHGFPRRSEPQMLHEMLHEGCRAGSDLHVCLCVEIGRSAVRPRPWPPPPHRRSQTCEGRPATTRWHSWQGVGP
ncbi:MAG: site-specific integrase [Actinomycetota bacterium]|nr:site-specific integrase [Actinomycetota bacterium]